MVNLGDKVKCRVTGLSGIVIARSQHLYGCDRVGIQPPVGSDGKVLDSWWVDVDAVEVIKAGVIKGHQATAPTAKTGGPSLPGQTPTRSNPR